MHDLLIVLRNFCVYQQGIGRRELRPGTVINLDAHTASKLIAKGYLELVKAAPAVVEQATEPPPKPMRKQKDTTPNGG